jgi:para-nitrobenzyl esterase
MGLLSPALCHKWDTPQLRLAGTSLGGLCEPPIGELRWRAPVPKNPENRICQCNCIQYKGAATVYTEYLLLDGIPEGFPTSEDSLSLNVRTPTKKSTMLHPVMVWIHGGGLNNGSSNSPWKDGAYIVKNHEDMIVVSIK